MRERILVTAELLFARQGVDKTSTRDITTEAGVNVASVNYYFRSKEALAEEIFMRLAQRVTVLRLADLSRVMDASRENRTALRLEDLVDCFIRPYFEPGVHGALLARFILQHRLDPSEMTHRVFEQYLNPFAMEFIEALCLTDKRISRVDWLWRYTLLTGTVMLAMTDVGPKNRMSALSDGQADASRTEDLKHQLADYLCRALRSG
ncbi:TetR/AcrR family transcriptional regulator [Variovorax sp. UC122_21]|uniref:TetR/AcrR family transcriptional regulator n=1 Tax=Variovorax sp. UC122_21 TaxID=3374554 RepID=UPI0037565BE3